MLAGTLKTLAVTAVLLAVAFACVQNPTQTDKNTDRWIPLKDCVHTTHPSLSGESIWKRRATARDQKVNGFRHSALDYELCIDPDHRMSKQSERIAIRPAARNQPRPGTQQQSVTDYTCNLLTENDNQPDIGSNVISNDTDICSPRSLQIKGRNTKTTSLLPPPTDCNMSGNNAPTQVPQHGPMTQAQAQALAQSQAQAQAQARAQAQAQEQAHAQARAQAQALAQAHAQAQTQTQAQAQAHAQAQMQNQTQHQSQPQTAEQAAEEFLMEVDQAVTETAAPQQEEPPSHLQTLMLVGNTPAQTAALAADSQRPGQAGSSQQATAANATPTAEERVSAPGFRLPQIDPQYITCDCTMELMLALTKQVEVVKDRTPNTDADEDRLALAQKHFQAAAMWEKEKPIGVDFPGARHSELGMSNLTVLQHPLLTGKPLATKEYNTQVHTHQSSLTTPINTYALHCNRTGPDTEVDAEQNLCPHCCLPPGNSINYSRQQYAVPKSVLFKNIVHAGNTSFITGRLSRVAELYEGAPAMISTKDKGDRIHITVVCENNKKMAHFLAELALNSSTHGLQHVEEAVLDLNGTWQHRPATWSPEYPKEADALPVSHNNCDKQTLINTKYARRNHTKLKHPHIHETCRGWSHHAGPTCHWAAAPSSSRKQRRKGAPPSCLRSGQQKQLHTRSTGLPKPSGLRSSRSELMAGCGGQIQLLDRPGATGRCCCTSWPTTVSRQVHRSQKTNNNTDAILASNDRPWSLRLKQVLQLNHLEMVDPRGGQYRICMESTAVNKLIHQAGPVLLRVPRRFSCVVVVDEPPPEGPNKYAVQFLTGEESDSNLIRTAGRKAVERALQLKRAEMVQARLPGLDPEIELLTGPYGKGTVKIRAGDIATVGTRLDGAIVLHSGMTLEQHIKLKVENSTPNIALRGATKVDAYPLLLAGKEALTLNPMHTPQRQWDTRREGGTNPDQPHIPWKHRLLSDDTNCRKDTLPASPPYAGADEDDHIYSGSLPMWSQMHPGSVTGNLKKRGLQDRDRWLGCNLVGLSSETLAREVALTAFTEADVQQARRNLLQGDNWADPAQVKTAKLTPKEVVRHYAQTKLTRTDTRKLYVITDSPPLHSSHTRREAGLGEAGVEASSPAARGAGQQPGASPGASTAEQPNANPAGLHTPQPGRREPSSSSPPGAPRPSPRPSTSTTRPQGAPTRDSARPLMAQGHQQQQGQVGSRRYPRAAMQLQRHREVQVPDSTHHCTHTCHAYYPYPSHQTTDSLLQPLQHLCRNGLRRCALLLSTGIGGQLQPGTGRLLKKGT